MFGRFVLGALVSAVVAQPAAAAVIYDFQTVDASTGAAVRFVYTSEAPVAYGTIYAGSGLNSLAGGVQSFRFIDPCFTLPPGAMQSVACDIVEVQITAPRGPTVIGRLFEDGVTGAPGEYRTVNLTPATLSVTLAGAVPEPATWGMLIGGFALIGAAIRRRAPAAVQA